MESRQPLRSLRGLKDSVIEYQVTYIKEEPVTRGGGHRGDVFIPPYSTPQHASAPIKEEPYSDEDKGVMYSHKYPCAGPTPLHTSPDMKEETDNEQVDHSPRVYTQRTSTSTKPDWSDIMMPGHTLQYPTGRVKEEPDSSDGRNAVFYPHGRNITNPDIYTQYPSAHVMEELLQTHTYTAIDQTSPYGIKEEPTAEDEGMDPALYIPAHHTQHRPNIKEDPTSQDEGMDPALYIPAHHTLRRSANIKGGPTSQDEGMDPALYIPAHHTLRRSANIKGEPTSRDESLDPALYIPAHHTLHRSANIKGEPTSRDEGLDPALYIPADNTQLRSANIKEEPISQDEGLDPALYIPAHHKQHRLNIKEDPTSRDEVMDPALYIPVRHTQHRLNIKEEPISQDEGMDPALYIPADHTQLQSANIKEEHDSCEEGNVDDPHIYTAIDLTPHNLSVHSKEEPFLCLVIEPPDDAEHRPSSHIKEEPDGDCLEDTETHTPTDRRREISAGDEEEMDSGDEVDASKKTPVNVGVQLIDNTDSSQNGCHDAAPSTDFTFKCLECEVSFTDKSGLEEHLALHRGKKPHVCSHCGKRFSYQSQRLIHERTHTGEKPFTCSDCGKCFNQYVHLGIHLMSHTGEKPYVCADCGKSFNRKTTLTIHQRIHTGEKPFHCPECGKYFSTSSNLSKHQRVHTREKPYSCSECGELFIHYTQLIRHQASHSSEKPFSCSVCGKSFSLMAQLLRHEKFHKMDSAYTCPECSQCFKRHKDLLDHQAAHAGEECGEQFEDPYLYSECGKSFNEHEVHVKEKSPPGGGGEEFDHETRLEGCPASPGEETWSCSVCGEQYRGSSDLIEHMMTHR